MAVRWRSVALSYNQFKDAVRPNPDIVVEEQSTSLNGNPVTVARFLKMSKGKQVARTSGNVIENPDRPLSAGTVDAWCRTLGLDATTFGIDDVR